jgi:hypothetical protein
MTPEGQTPPDTELFDTEITEVLDEATASGLTFDEFMDSPAEVRAEIYITISSLLLIEPQQVPDEWVEILGEGYFRDQSVWSEAGHLPRLDREWDVWFGGEESDWNGFIERVAEGDPQAGIEGDPTLKYFAYGGDLSGGISGFFAGFKYPLGYTDRKDFMPFLSTVGLGAWGPASSFAVQAGAGIAGAWSTSAGAVSRFAAGRGATRLSHAFGGMSPNARRVVGLAGTLGKGLGSVMRGLQALVKSKPFQVFAGTATGVGLYSILRDASKPLTAAEIESTTAQTFQDALSEGDLDEAKLIMAGAVSQGIDTSGFATDQQTGEPFTYPDPVTSQPIVPGSEVGLINLDAPAIGRSGWAASFGPGGTVSRVGNFFPVDEDELMLKLLSPTGDGLAEDYRASRWILEDPEFDSTYGNQRFQRSMTGRHVLPKNVPLHPNYMDTTSAVTGRDITPTEGNFYAAMTGGTPTTGTSPTDALDRAGVGMDKVAPIFREYDNSRYLSQISPNQLVGLQSRLIDIGYLNPDASMSGASFRPGIIDDFTMRAMGVVFGDMNANGYTDVNEFLNDAEALKEKFPDLGGGRQGTGRVRAPFERRAYVAPDYDTLTQYVKGVAEQKVRRSLNQSEMSLLADQMKVDHRASFDVVEAARKAQYDAAGRGADPGFVGEEVDPEASFKEFFEKRYADEIKRGETVEQTYASTRNLFAGFDNAARLIGR